MWAWLRSLHCLQICSHTCMGCLLPPSSSPSTCLSGGPSLREIGSYRTWNKSAHFYTYLHHGLPSDGYFRIMPPESKVNTTVLRVYKWNWQEDWSEQINRYSNKKWTNKQIQLVGHKASLEIRSVGIVGQQEEQAPLMHIMDDLSREKKRRHLSHAITRP